MLPNKGVTSGGGERRKEKLDEIHNIGKKLYSLLTYSHWILGCKTEKRE
jgi:hypothetical protein